MRYHILLIKSLELSCFFLSFSFQKRLGTTVDVESLTSITEEL